MSTYEIARQWAEYYGYSVHISGGDRQWFSAIKDTHAGPLSMEVNVKEGDTTLEFSLHHIVDRSMISIKTPKLAGLENPARFLKFQRQMIEVMEKIY